jgi:hypothetical protein
MCVRSAARWRTRRRSSNPHQSNVGAGPGHITRLLVQEALARWLAEPQR